MKKAGVFLSAALLATSLQAKEVGGVNVPETFKTDSAQELVLNGAGVRAKFLIDLYVGALYLKQQEQDAASIIAQDDAMAIRLEMVSNMVTSEKMTEATMEGFENSTKGNLAPIKAEIDSFMATFGEPIKKGDVFDLVYVPAEGVKVYKNGSLKNTVAGAAFKQALFGIWLSDKPAQKSLKAGMLGK